MSQITETEQQPPELENKLQAAVIYVLQYGRTIAEAAQYYGVSYFIVYRKIQIAKYLNEHPEKKDDLEKALKLLGTYENIRRAIPSIQAIFDINESILKREVGFAVKHKSSLTYFRKEEEILLIEILKTFAESSCICKTCTIDRLPYVATELSNEKQMPTDWTTTELLTILCKLLNSYKNEFIFAETCIDCYIYRINLCFGQAKTILQRAFQVDETQCNCRGCSMERLPKEIYKYVKENMSEEECPQEWKQEQQAESDYVKYFMDKYDLISVHIPFRLVCKKELIQPSTSEQQSSLFDLIASLDTEDDFKVRQKRDFDTSQLSNDEAATKRVKLNASQSSTCKGIKKKCNWM